jgi:hypothetical protein
MKSANATDMPSRFFHFSPSNCWLFHSIQFFEVMFIAPGGQKHSLTIAISHRLAGRAVLCTAHHLPPFTRFLFAALLP